MTPVPPVRLRLRYAKHGKIRFTSHRDTARTWERVLRRCALPLAYTEGFSPRPKMHFGLALRTGFSSDSEYLDINLQPGSDIDLDALPALLSGALPVGIDVTAVAHTPAISAVSLQEAVTSCRWLVDMADTSPEAARGIVDAALAADELPVTRFRKGRERTFDIRPTLAHFEVLGVVDDCAQLEVELQTQPRGFRPDELVAAVDPDLVPLRVRRTHQWIETDGVRAEPLAAPPSPADIAQVSAA